MKPILLLASMLAASAFAQDRFASNHVWDFNGREWSGIRLSGTTWRDLERSYDAQSYAIHDNTLRMAADYPARLNVYAIFADTREDSRVGALRLEYYGDEPKLDDFTRRMDEEGREYWHPARNSDWSILAYRRSGVIAVVKGSGRERRATTYFLVEPNRMDAILAPYSTRPNEKLTVGGLTGGPYRDPDRWRGDFASFGSVLVENRIDGNMPRGMSNGDLRDFRSWAERKFRDKESGSMRFQNRSLGTIRVNARWNDFDRNSDEGDLDIEATFTARSGENITVRDTHHVDINGSYQRAWEKAIDNVLRTLEDRTEDEVRKFRNNNDSREPDVRGRYDREISLSEAMEELARAAVGRTGFERGGRIIDRNRGGGN